MRLFYALWPGRGLRHQLASWQRAHLPADVVPTHIDDLHMTLHFLGQVPPERLNALLAIGDSFHPSVFNMTLDRLGYFPRAKALWAGSVQPDFSLARFQRTLGERLQQKGFTIENRDYQPHVTLARKAAGPLQMVDLQPLSWEARVWGLIESRPGNRPLYRPLALWPLSEK